MEQPKAPSSIELSGGPALLERNLPETPPSDARLVPISFSLNGRAISLRASPETALASLLRDTLGLTGTKIGCDRGACSACTVWIDGEVAASCMTFALDIRGKHVTTIEGLARNGEMHTIQKAFVEHDALQCGFCTPGMVMSCAALVERNPNCSIEDIKTAIGGHLCRCGTYLNIFKATLAAADRMKGKKK